MYKELINRILKSRIILSLSWLKLFGYLIQWRFFCFLVCFGRGSIDKTDFELPIYELENNLWMSNLLPLPPECQNYMYVPLSRLLCSTQDRTKGFLYPRQALNKLVCIAYHWISFGIGIPRLWIKQLSFLKRLWYQLIQIKGTGDKQRLL